MGNFFRTLFKPLITASPPERLKIFYLASCLASIVGVYTILKPLKDAVFFVIVGKAFQPNAKWLTLLAMPLCMLVYSKLVDRLRRYQLVSYFCFSYAIFFLILGYFLRHPAYGLSNTDSSPWRILGWVMYVVLDIFPVLVVSTFWSFSNSISSPEGAKKSYSFIVAASKIAGTLSPLAVLAMVNFAQVSQANAATPACIISSFFLLLATYCISRLMKKVPGPYLHGYEAAYELEKGRAKLPKTGIWEGFKLMLVEPYVFGIFGMVYSYEIISQIIDYQKNVMASIHYNNVYTGMFSFGLLYSATFQAIGFLFALFGTSSLLAWFDVEKCLLMVPVITGGLLVSLLVFPSLTTIFFVMVLLRAIHYGFNLPIREMLYIPTTKDVKFKAKGWTDSFGRTLSKGTGATVNKLMVSNGSKVGSCITNGSLFSLGMVGIWTAISYFVVQRYRKTITTKRVIGEDQ